MTIEKIISPCVRNCCLNEDDVCLGCFRSIGEIIQWSGATEHQKEKIINTANRRKVDHQRKYASSLINANERKKEQN